ncbi:MAG: alpha/beta hydrolase [Propionibacteriaceae bacterium]
MSRVVLAVGWLCLGAAMVAVPVWLGWTRWSVILSGHPLTLTVTILCAMAGVVAVAWAIATLLVGDRYDMEITPGQPGYRTPAQIRRRAEWRIGLAVPALVICLATVSVLAWSRPFAATDIAIAATRSGDNVRVSDRFTWFEMQSVREDSLGREIKPRAGLIFYPGARVDSRAYAHLFKPLANAGYLVVVLKSPFGIALADVDKAQSVLDVHPEIATWAVGGHSLGGVAASSFADDNPARVKGLLLYASYPSSAMTRTDLKVLSLSGTNDGLATPADIEKSKPDLPPSTRYVAIKGGVHSFFGDYGDQPGDGTPTVSRAVAQTQIVKFTQAFLVSITPVPKKK